MTKHSAPKAAPLHLVERRQDFLDALAESGNVVKACRESGFPRTSAYRLRTEDTAFAAAWAEAVDIGNDALEDEAIRRAVEGTEEEIWYGGERKGTARKYSDSLLVFLLKARRPEKFRDRIDVGTPDDQPIPVLKLSVRDDSKK